MLILYYVLMVYEDINEHSDRISCLPGAPDILSSRCNSDYGPSDEWCKITKKRRGMQLLNDYFSRTLSFRKDSKGTLYMSVTLTIVSPI